MDYVEWTGSAGSPPPPPSDPNSGAWGQIDYKYDVVGRRIEKDVDGYTTKYLYDGGNVIAEYDGNNNLLRKYTYGPGIDQPVSMTEVGDSSSPYYYHYDALGSVVALSDSTGATVQTYEYSVYGQVAVEDANHPNPYMFAGRRFDMEIGLYYNRARYYNPFTGRFLQTDPIGYADGINWYSYCGNRPTTLTDPSGRDAYVVWISDSLPNDEGRYEMLHVGIAVGNPGDGYIFGQHHTWIAGGHGVDPLETGQTLEGAVGAVFNDSFVIGFMDKDGSDEAIADFLRSGVGPGPFGFCTDYVERALESGGYYFDLWVTPDSPRVGLSTWPCTMAEQLVADAATNPRIYVYQWAEWGKYSEPDLLRYFKSDNSTGGPVGPWTDEPVADPDDVDVYVGYAADHTGGTYWIDSGGLEYKGHVGGIDTPH